MTLLASRVGALSIGVCLAVYFVPDLRCSAASGSSPGGDDWPTYGRDPGGMRYSPLSQINRETVRRLKVAWTFHTGDLSDGKGEMKRSGFETTPVVVDGRMYLTTPFNRVLALDPQTGRQAWAYDPKTKLSWNYGDGLINRGVATWVEAAGNENHRTRRRIFEATLDARLVAVDAETGEPCREFGDRGQVSLRQIPRYIAGAISHDLSAGCDRRSGGCRLGYR